MGSRTMRRWVARLTLAVVLFAHGVMAASCDWTERSPVRAVVAAAEVAACHESGFGAACLAHCLADRQVVQKVTLDVPAMPPAPVLALELSIEAVGQPQVAGLATGILGTGPPRRILFQSFRL